MAKKTRLFKAARLIPGPGLLALLAPLADYAVISTQRDTDFVTWMTQQKGVAAIPLSPFYAKAPQSTLIRFCFCKDDATLEAAAAILRAL